MLYLDTSCLLKVFFPEPETARTLALVVAEDRVIVSDLARLEMLVQIRSRAAGGVLGRALAGRLVARADGVLATPPYELAACPPTLLRVAERQVRARGSTPCRTLDRLHLAAMEALGVRRLLTNDEAQARAGRALGFDVALPR